MRPQSARLNDTTLSTGVFLKCNADKIWAEMKLLLTLNSQVAKCLFVVYLAANVITNICKNVFLTFHLSIHFSAGRGGQVICGR